MIRSKRRNKRRLPQYITLLQTWKTPFQPIASVELLRGIDGADMRWALVLKGSLKKVAKQNNHKFRWWIFEKLLEVDKEIGVRKQMWLYALHPEDIQEIMRLAGMGK